LSETGRNFVKVLAENQRLGIIGDIASAFESERARAERRSDVKVVAAYELTAAQQNDINVAMTRRLGTKVDISVTVDREIIGGVIIRCGDLVIDASVRGRLAQLAQTLA
jgi:F-type H+-transporting ATPase subunit delta